MRRVLLTILFIILLSSCREKSGKTGQFTVTDDLGNEFVFSGVPGRVISLAPSITESIFYLNADSHLAGITDYCDYPQGVVNKARVGGMLDPNTEIIASLKPDLIFITTEGNSQVTYKNLTGLGYRVFVFNPKTVDDISRMLERLNDILKPEKGNGKIKEFADGIKITDSRKRTFAGFLSVKPLVTFSSRTFLSDIFAKCGFINVYGDEKLDYPAISDEDLSVKNPEYLMIMLGTGDGLKEKIIAEINKRFGSLEAVRSNKVIFLDESIFSRPGPRVVKAMQILKEAGN